MVPWANMFALPPWTGDETFVDLAADWYLDGYQAPDPVEIEWDWLSGSIRFRQDRPITVAQITKSGAGPAVARAISDELIEFNASLEALNDVDAPNYAHWLVTYYDQARTRLSKLELVLNKRTEEEIWTILGVTVGTRISITGVPDGYPRGADQLIVEGIHHIAGGNASARVVEWSTSPVIGTEVGEVGPYFRVGVTQLDDETYLLPW